MPYLPKKKKKAYKRRRKSSNTPADKRFYDSGAWKKLRIRQLHLVPYCEVCKKDVVKGGHIDHIVRRKEGGAPLDENNLQTLCRRCHNVKSRMERHGYKVAHQGKRGQYTPRPGEKSKLIERIYENINNRETGMV